MGNSEIIPASHLSFSLEEATKRRGLIAFLRVLARWSSDSADRVLFDALLPWSEANLSALSQASLQLVDQISSIASLSDFAKFPSQLQSSDPQTQKQLPIIAAIIQNNSMAIETSTSEHIGKGVYLIASFFNHACNPNCVVSFHGTTLRV